MSYQDFRGLENGYVIVVLVMNDDDDTQKQVMNDDSGKVVSVTKTQRDRPIYKHIVAYNLTQFHAETCTCTFDWSNLINLYVFSLT